MTAPPVNLDGLTFGRKSLGVGSWWAKDAPPKGIILGSDVWLNDTGDGFVIVDTPTFESDDPMPDQVDTTIDPWTRVPDLRSDGRMCAGFPPRPVGVEHSLEPRPTGHSPSYGPIDIIDDPPARAERAFASLRTDRVYTQGPIHVTNEPDLEDSGSLGARPAKRRHRR